MNEYKANARCKRFVDVDRLRKLEGQRFGSFQALVRALGWTPYVGGDMKICDVKRLQHYCELQFHEGTCKVTVVRVF